MGGAFSLRKAAIIIALVALVVALAAGCTSQSRTASQVGSGIAWRWNDLAGGKQQAKREGKKIFLYFGSGY